MKQLLLIFLVSIITLSCDSKKTSIAGKVVNGVTGEGVNGLLISYVQCQENGENCAETIIGQTYTQNDGSFKIDQKRANTSKTKWITVYNGTKKLAQFDNVGLTDKNITIIVTP